MRLKKKKKRACVEELPSAPRDMLLKIVTNFHLRTAPMPILDTLKPRKHPLCLVKGMCAKTFATHLPENTKIPTSIPATILAINSELKKQTLDGGESHPT